MKTSRTARLPSLLARVTGRHLLALLLTSSAACTYVNNIGQPGDPAGYNSCAGNSSTTPRKAGAADGAPCSDSSECAQTTCSCGGSAPYYAGACIGGVCKSGDACACVADEFQKNFHHDICD